MWRLLRLGPEGVRLAGGREQVGERLVCFTKRKRALRRSPGTPAARRADYAHVRSESGLMGVMAEKARQSLTSSKCRLQAC